MKLKATEEMAFHVYLTIEEYKEEGCTDVIFLGWYDDGYSWTPIFEYTTPDGLRVQTA
jgi:hypothetical protein